VPRPSQDRLIGVLNLGTARDGRLTEEAFDIPKLIASRIGTAVDNAQLYRQEEMALIQVQEFYERVHKLEQLRTDMIRIASHDLRNPLAAILTDTELINMDLEESGEESVAWKEYIQSVDHAARRMRKIVDDILSLERIEQTGDE